MFIYLKISNMTTEKITVVFSNVAGPKTPIEYEGKRCHKMAFLLPALGKISCGLSLLTTGNTMKMGLLCDENVCAEPQVLVRLLEETLREILSDGENQQ